VNVPIAGRDPVPPPPGRRHRSPVAPVACLEGPDGRLVAGGIPEKVVLHAPVQGPQPALELGHGLGVTLPPGLGKPPQNGHRAPGPAVVRGSGLAPSSPWAGFPVPGGFPASGQLTSWKGRAWTGAHG